jgi:hypothetical protein
MIVFVPFYEIYVIAGGQWLKPIIPATWEAEIGRIKVQGQPGQNNQSKMVDVGFKQ